METINNNYSKLECAILFFLTVLFCGLYVPVNVFTSFMQVDYGIYFLTKYDELIPYSTNLFFIYILYYLVFFIIIFIFLKTEYDIIPVRKISSACIMLYLTGYLIFLFFPNSSNALAKGVSQDPQNASIYFFNKYITTPFGANPSLHVGTAWLFLKAWRNFFPDFRFKSLCLFLFYGWFIVLVISTLTLKYHYIIDAICGILLAEFIYWILISKNILHAEKWSLIGYKRLLVLETALMISTLLFFIISQYFLARLLLNQH